MPDQGLQFDPNDPMVRALAQQPPLVSKDISQSFLTGAGNLSGISDAVRALHGQMTPEEQQAFALTAALGLIPGARAETMGAKAAGELAPQLERAATKAEVAAPDISQAAIDKKLAQNPGASIFDVAGTHIGGPSEGFTPKSILGGVGQIFPQDTFADIPRQVPFKPSPQALAAGYNVPLVHGTRAEVPFTQFGLPEETGGMPEIGIHAGSPKAAQHFAGDTLMAGSDTKPRTYPLVMKAQNPLVMPDIGTWGPARMSSFLSEMHSDKFSNDELAQATKPIAGFKREFSTPRGKLEEANQNLRDLIKSKGFDSIKYKNEVEDPGHMSYIALDPSQLRSPWAAFKDLSSRDLLAGLAGGAVAAPAVTGQNYQDMVKALGK